MIATVTSSQSFSAPRPSNAHPIHRPSCSSSSTFPTLLPHLSPPPFPPCHLTSLPHKPFLTLLPDLSPPPFPSCHLTSLPCLVHLATSPLSPTFLTLLPDLSPPPFPSCHLTPTPHLSHFATSPLSSTFPNLLPELFPPPFPSCHLTSLNHLSHLATSPLSPTFPTLPPHLSPHLSHLTTLPHFATCHHTIIPPFPLCHLTALPPFQPSQPTSFPPSQLVTLVLRDLTIAISITRNRIFHNLTKAQPSPCNTNLRSQIPHASNSPTPHIQSTPNVLTSFR